jgi:hypothetical protein
MGVMIKTNGFDQYFLEGEALSAQSTHCHYHAVETTGFFLTGFLITPVE